MIVEDSYCIGEAKQFVIDMAKVNALQDAYGTAVVSGTDFFQESISKGNNNSVHSTFKSKINTTVKGTWLSTSTKSIWWELIEENENQILWLHCKISGKAMEIKNSSNDLLTSIHKCNTGDGCETNEFKEGESIYMNIKSANKGFVSIFLEENGKIYRLFPYTKMENNISINADQDYFFFSYKHSSTFEQISKSTIIEYGLSALKPRNLNRIFVIYSPSDHLKPVMTYTEGIKQTSFDNFEKWVSKIQTNSEGVQTKIINIIVTK